MLCTPFRKSKEEDLKTSTERCLANTIVLAAEANNNGEYSSVISIAARIIQYANTLADLKADENR